jgi:hypothetical protein
VRFQRSRTGRSKPQELRSSQFRHTAHRAGWSAPVIADRVGCSPSSIYRRLEAADVSSCEPPGPDRGAGPGAVGTRHRRRPRGRRVVRLPSPGPRTAHDQGPGVQATTQAPLPRAPPRGDPSRCQRQRQRQRPALRGSPNFSLTLTPPLNCAGSTRTGAGCPTPGTYLAGRNVRSAASDGCWGCLTGPGHWSLGSTLGGSIVEVPISTSTAVATRDELFSASEHRSQDSRRRQPILESGQGPEAA